MQQELGAEQQIMGHIEKKEELDEDVTEIVPAAKDTEDTTTEEESIPAGPRKRATQSIIALKRVAAKAKIREQKRRWDEATKWRHAMEEGLGDVDLEEVMEHTENPGKMDMTVAETVTTTAATASSSTHVVTAKVYTRPYAKTAESQGERSKARSEQKDAKERELMIWKQKEEEERLAKEKEQQEQRKVVECALLEEEEKSQEEILRKMCESEERKKRKEKEARKRKYIEQEEERFVDDEERDPDFDPDREFIEDDDMVIEDEEEETTFQVEKHSHALNFSEAGEFVIWV